MRFDSVNPPLSELAQRAAQPLPDGVHRLSPESHAILKRAADRDAELEARFIKRGS